MVEDISYIILVLTNLRCTLIALNCERYHMLERYNQQNLKMLNTIEIIISNGISFYLK